MIDCLAVSGTAAPRRHSRRFARSSLSLVALHAGLLVSVAQAGYFTVEQRGAAWWFADPSGTLFQARAVNAVGIGPAPDKLDPANPGYCGLKFFPDAAAWATETSRRFRAWGFNTVGGYSDHAPFHAHGMPFTVALWLGGNWGVPWVDLKDPVIQKGIRDMAVEMCTPLKDDPLLLGWFPDNELGWWDETVFMYWFQRPGKERLKAELVAMLKAEYRGDLRALLADFVVLPRPKKFDDLKKELTSAAFAPGRRPAVVDRFIEQLADEYYATVCGAIRAVDPNHLILGDRYLSYYSQGVVRAAGRHVDVVSANYNTYAPSGWVSRSFFDTLYRLSRKPIMVTEYYFSAMENATGNKNSHGPFIVVPTQRERATGAGEMTRRLAAFPGMVGYHWFQHADEPPLGRPDGEDFNFGLVDTQDRPYPELIAAFTAANRAAEALHTTGGDPVGLARAGDEWRVPRAAWSATPDGRLDEWDLPGTFAPDPAAAPPYLPFADFHLAWAPEGLRLGVVYMDYSQLDEPDPADPLNLPRIVLTVRRDGVDPVTLTLRGFRERVGPKPAEPKKGEKAPPDDRPAAPITALADAQGRVTEGADTVRGAQSRVSITSIGEVAIPVGALGGRPLVPGEVLELRVSLRLRGDTKTTRWPEPGDRPASVRLVGK